MDRPVALDIRRWIALRRAAIVALVVVGGILGFVGLRYVITPTLDPDQIRTAIVEEGPMLATISASGTVVPKFEEVVSSPVDSRVLVVHRKPGARVREGEPILELDPTALRLELANLAEQISLQENAQRSKELALRKSIIDLESKRELKQVDLQSHEAKHQRLQRLSEDGLVAADQLLEAELDIRRARIELRQIADSIHNLRESTGAELDRIGLETKILRQKEADQERLLDLTTTRAKRDGVLTWVVESEGTAVREGDVLARIADPNDFRVDATLSDVYSPRLREGLDVSVEVDGARLEGVVQTILPTIDNGTLTLEVALDDPRYEALRSNLRVDVFIIAEQRGRARFVRKGPFVNGSGRQEVFTVHDGAAYRREVEVGMTTFENVEILSGLEVGEEVIISDMSSYLHMSRIEIR